MITNLIETTPAPVCLFCVAMGPRKCIGFTVSSSESVQCCFNVNPLRPGTPAQGKFDERCLWCNPTEIERRCKDERLRKLLIYDLKKLIVVNHGNADFLWLPLSRIPEPWRKVIRKAVNGSSRIDDDSATGGDTVNEASENENDQEKENEGKHKANHRSEPEGPEDSSANEESDDARVKRREGKRRAGEKFKESGQSRVVRTSKKVLKAPKTKRDRKASTKQGSEKDLDKKDEDSQTSDSGTAKGSELVREALYSLLPLSDVQSLASECQKIKEEIFSLSGSEYPKDNLRSVAALVPPDLLDAFPSCKAALAAVQGVDEVSVSCKLARQCIIFLLELLTNVEAWYETEGEFRKTSPATS